MSDSDGSYLGPDSPDDSCATLRFDIQLASPKVQVIAELQVGDILGIAFGQGSNQVVVTLQSGAEAGGIVGPCLSRPRNHMNQNEQFQARILDISGGQVRVRVHHVQSRARRALMITIVGGIHRERCMRPGWDDIYGSAGRAATAIARFGGKAELYACVDSETQEVIETRTTAEDSKFNGTPTQVGVAFRYVHGLANPGIRHETHVRSTLIVSGEKVLRFGMIDGTAVVNADFAVYDPQNADEPGSFSASGSTAKYLALVLNRHKASLLLPGSCGLRPEEIVTALAKQEGAGVIVIKMGPLGALVYDDGKISAVPTYRTERVQEIGSGDTFATHFALAWLDNGLFVRDAASIASIATAFYCECRGLPNRALLTTSKPRALQPSQRCRDGYISRVYLTGPFFTLAELQMVGQARRGLKAMGFEVFSPYHDVGLGTAKDVVEKDLEDVHNYDVLFAVGDSLGSGTVFEVGYARALNKPAVFYAESESEQDQKMIEGSNCTMTDDRISAIYQMV